MGIIIIMFMYFHGGYVGGHYNTIVGHIMIYCANCMNCKIKVDVYCEEKPRWARFVYCSKGRKVTSRGQKGRLLSRVKLMTKSQCDDYDPFDENKALPLDIRRYQTCINYDGLEWYYKNGVDLERDYEQHRATERHAPRGGKHAPANCKVLS